MDHARDPGVRFDHTLSGAMSIVAAHGEFDLHAAAPLHAAVDLALHDRPLILAIDLRGVTFMDAGTVDELVAIGRRCEAEGRRLMLVRGDPRIDRLFVTCSLDVVSGLDEIPGGGPAEALGLEPA